MSPELPGLLLSNIIRRHVLEAARRPTLAPGRYTYSQKDRARLQNELRLVSQAGSALIPVAVQLIRERKYRHEGAFLLKQLKQADRDTLRLLMNALLDEDKYVRLGAARALARVARPTPANLLGLLQHENPRIREVAVIAVVGSGAHSFESLPVLHRLLQDPDSRLKQTVIIETKNLRKPALTARVLIERLDQEEGQNFYRLLWRLADFDMRLYMDRLIPLAHDPNSLTRDMALYTIARGSRFAEAQRPLLIAALNDESLLVRSTATSMLTGYKRPPSPSILPTLLGNMLEPNQSLVWVSAHLIVYMNSPRAIPELRKLAVHSSRNINIPAKYALEKLSAGHRARSSRRN